MDDDDNPSTAESKRGASFGAGTGREPCGGGDGSGDVGPVRRWRMSCRRREMGGLRREGGREGGGAGGRWGRAGRIG